MSLVPAHACVTEQSRVHFGRRIALAALGPPSSRSLLATHLLGIIASGWVTVAMADSLFFALDTEASRRHVVLYLVVTMIPVLALPRLIGPAVDRAGGGPRQTARGSNVWRSLSCIGLVATMHSQAFALSAICLLIGNKVYNTSKYALLPTLVPPHALVAANVRLAKWGGATGMASLVSGIWLSHVAGPRALLLCAAMTFLGAARALKPAPTSEWHAPCRPGQGRPIPRRALRAAIPLLAVRSCAGLFGLTCAFAVRRAGGPAVAIVVVAGCYGAGSFIGNLLAPATRRRFSEEQMMILAITPAVLGCTGALLIRWSPVTIFAALTLGFATSHVRQGFDSVLQSQARNGAAATSYARIESASHLVWVIGGCTATTLQLDVRVCLGVVATILVVGLASLPVWSARLTRTPVAQPGVIGPTTAIVSDVSFPSTALMR